MISYAAIRAPRTQDQVLAERIQNLQGVSPVVQTGPGGLGAGLGTGRVLATGVARTTVDVVVQVVASGEPNDGIAQYALSLDGGATFGAAAAITTAAVPVSSTGASIVFVAGLGGADPSFVAGELYSFSVATPVWDATAWQRFSAPRRLIDLETKDASIQDQAIRDVAGGGFLYDAVGPWLDLVAEHVYDEERSEAVSAQKWLTLTDTAGIGPITIDAGTQWARDTTGRIRYSNLSAGVVPLNGSLQLLWQAESPGVAYNLGNGGLVELVTPMPGVTITDGPYITAPVQSRSGAPGCTAAIGTLLGTYDVLVEVTTGGALGAAVLRWSPDGGGAWVSGVTMPADGVLALASTGVVLTFAAGTYLVGDEYSCLASITSIAQAGTEIESDDSLRERCASKWPTLTESSAAPGQAFEKWAKDAAAQVTQAMAEASSMVPGQTNLYLAGAAGAVDASVVSTVNAAVQPHLGTTDTCLVASATPLTIVLTGTVRVLAGLGAAAQAAALIALAEYQAACPIGGYQLGGSTGISREKLIGCLTQGSQRSPVVGSVDLTLTAPAADVAMAVPQTAVLDVTGLVWSEI